MCVNVYTWVNLRLDGTKGSGIEGYIRPSYPSHRVNFKNGSILDDMSLGDETSTSLSRFQTFEPVFHTNQSEMHYSR